MHCKEDLPTSALLLDGELGPQNWVILDSFSTPLLIPLSSFSKGSGASAESNQHFAGETENTKESLQIISECNCSWSLINEEGFSPP